MNNISRNFLNGMSVKPSNKTNSNLSMRIIRTKADGKQPSAFKNCVAEDKDKRFSETKEIIAGKQQSKVRNLGKHVVTRKSSNLCKMYRKKPKTSQKWLVFGFFGRSGGTRTRGLQYPKLARYQLRYTSIW